MTSDACSRFKDLLRGRVELGGNRVELGARRRAAVYCERPQNGVVDGLFGWGGGLGGAARRAQR